MYGTHIVAEENPRARGSKPLWTRMVVWKNRKKDKEKSKKLNSNRFFRFSCIKPFSPSTFSHETKKP